MEQIWRCPLDTLQWEECGTPEKDSLHKEEAVANPQQRLESLGGLHTYTTTFTSVVVELTTPPSCLCSRQSPYFIFALFTLLTSLLVKYSHSHPPYYLCYLCYFATFIRLAQCHHAHPLLTFFFPFMNLRIPQGQEANRWIRKTRTTVR